jgi:hypothetical protein
MVESLLLEHLKDLPVPTYHQHNHWHYKRRKENRICGDKNGIGNKCDAVGERLCDGARPRLGLCSVIHVLLDVFARGPRPAGAGSSPRELPLLLSIRGPGWEEFVE